jgi:hypothetical protein
MPPILDVAIGTVFVFLLFSLVVSAFNELLLSHFDMRAKFLHKGLQELLGEGTSPTGFFARRFSSLWMLLRYRTILSGRTKALCEHGLINALSRSDRGTGASPSYIPAGAFVTALFDLLKRQNNQGYSTHTLNDLLVAIQALPPTCKLREGLESLAARTGIQLGEFEVAVEGWFNSSMDRVSGWYKRFCQNWMLLIGFTVAAVLNVDTIHIVQVLSKSPNLARAVAAQAEAYQKASSRFAADPGNMPELRRRAQTRLEDARKALNSAKETGNGEEIEKSTKEWEEARAAEEELSADSAFRNALADLSATAIPIGWNEAAFRRMALDRLAPVPQYQDSPGWNWISYPWHLASNYTSRHWKWLCENPCPVLTLLAGWLLTAIAGSMGAPLWFDLLSRFVNLRAAGRAPGQSPLAREKLQPSMDTISTPQGSP